jgi:hypothetical protein
MGAESLFLARQLEVIRPQVLEVQYSKLLGRSVVPVKYEGDAGASSIVQQIEDVAGFAKVISDRARDLPKVNIKRGEYNYPIRDLGVSFDYSRRELAAAERNGISLPAKKAVQARNVMERTLDFIIAFGDADSGLPGFLNNTQIAASNVAADGTGSSTLWTNKTEDQILRDLFALVNSISDGSKDVFRATDVLLPLSSYNLIAAKPMGLYRNTTILQFFKQTFPYGINVTPWYFLETAGAGATKRMVAYERTPDVLGVSIQQEFNMLAPQEVGLMVEVPCTLVTAGVLIDQPMAIAFRDGI